MSEYVPVIDGVIKDLTAQFPDRLHSIYVYGSVARGNAVKGKSDLDLLVVFNAKPDSSEQAEVKQLAEKLSASVRPSLREVGIEVTDLKEVTSPENLYGWGAYVAIFCLCIWGEDLAKTFPRFKLTPEIAFGFNGDIEAAVQKFTEQIRSEDDDEKLLLLCSQMSRKLIRTSYSMILSRTQISTSSLQTQVSLFTEYFPTKKTELDQLLEWTTDPTSDKQELSKMLQNYGSWLVVNFPVEAKKTARG